MTSWSYFSESDCDEGVACNESSSSVVDYDSYQDWTVLGPVTAAYGLIFLLGLTGNAMVIFAVHRCRRLHTTTSLLLANLAVADLLLVVLLIPAKVVVETLDDWVLGEAMCRIIAFINVVCPTCSIFTMTVIALERCYAVLFPLETKSTITMGRTRIAILVVWLLSLAMCIPSLFSKTTTRIDVGVHVWTVCNDGWSTDDAALGYAIYVMVILFGLPVLVLAVCYALVIVRLCSSKRLTRHMRPLSAANIQMNRFRDGEGGDGGRSRPTVTSEETGELLQQEGARDDAGHRLGSPTCRRADERSVAYTDPVQAAERRQRRPRTEAEKLQRIVIMLITVVVIFMLCWGPLFIYGLLLRLGLTGQGNFTDDVWKISLALHLLAYGNSCINPFVYAFMSESFREGFAVACRGCLRGDRRGRGTRKMSKQQSSYWTSSNLTTRNMSLSSATTCRV